MSKFKFVIAQMKHETNTFSSVPTPISAFSRASAQPPEGDDAIRETQGTETGLGALLAVADEAGADYCVPIAATAWPSGIVPKDAFEYITGRIVDAVRRGCDAVLLDLHGAMVTDEFDDAEGELLRRIRAVAPDVPIGVAMDMHTNFSQQTADLATVIAGYRTYPHIDMYETGLRAARPIIALLRGESRPTMVCGFRPMLPHIMRQSSLDEPNASIQARAQAMEQEGAIAATFFTGFPHADHPYTGVSAVVVTENDPALAQRMCDELLGMAWDARAQFVYTPQPLQESLARAATLDTSRGPVVLLDHYDNTASGGTMDTMTVLAGIMQAGLDQVAAFAVYDPEVVKQAAALGEGSTLTVALGGKHDMPAIQRKGEPYRVTARVKRIVEGRYRNLGPMARGELNNMGLCAVLDTGKVEIAVISQRVEPHDLACFQVLGIDPASKRFLMLKSRVHWRAGLGPLASHVVECAGTGVCTSDYSQLHFRRIRRPMYPLDQEF